MMQIMRLRQVMAFGVLVGLVGACGDKKSASKADASANDSDAPPKDEWALFKKVGRSWLYKEGSGGFTRMEVTKVEKTEAVVKITMLDASKQPSGEPMEFHYSFVKRAHPDTEDIDGSDVKSSELVEEKCDGPKGPSACLKHEWAPGSTKWYSKKWPGLVVKASVQGRTKELVEFNE